MINTHKGANVRVCLVSTNDSHWNRDGGVLKHRHERIRLSLLFCGYAGNNDTILYVGPQCITHV